MKIGVVGLGRMGAGITKRLQEHGHEVSGYDHDPAISPTHSLQELVAGLPTPRVVWVMVPAGDPTEATVTQLASLMADGDIVIEGGNSYYRDSIRRAEMMKARGIQFLDAGTSGGIWGLEVGFCLMVGGPETAFRMVEPIFADLAPAGGYALVGPSGAGHFVKMVHNGIEYGMLQAYAEGFDLLHAADFPLDLHSIAAVWNQGSVVRSWLLELAERALAKDPGLDALRGYVDDSGEGRWTVLEAVERGVPATSIAHALFARFSSRESDSFAMKMIAALRNEFGGHAVKPE
ncbi:MAG: decarboxylating 6-phosphogluconate dehydrogenase [Dehalococcoidia bacterium]|nr:decarboxylating 6-phosphogluconate dehydrogenase [Dehalococcoidia bacterium]